MASTLQGRAPFNSAWGMRKRLPGQFTLLRKECISSGHKTINPWIDFYFSAIAVTANTLDLSDSLGGSNNIFIMSD